jgi:3-hydroxyacyl-CoA dehydrogenase/enoyl-CoA hydratase/3-hydroxybutyryl-CoA epimerase
MHFFNPVHRMPLVEVIYGARTSPVVTATVFDLARRMGKTPVVVKDGPGFLVNRILAPYLGEAGRLLAEGYTVESIDRAMRRFGMPVGPIELLDDVGLDVAAKGSETLAAAWPERMALASAVAGLVGKGRIGRKAGKGFYRYQGGRRKGVDPGTFADAGITAPQKTLGAEEAEARLVLPMVNEAAFCLADGVVPEPAKLDLAMIFGTGFPPFRGGPLRYADARGLQAVVDSLKRLEQQHGGRYTPAPELVERAGAGRSFFG